MNLEIRQKFANYFGPAFHGMTLKRWMQVLNDPNLNIEFPYHYRILPTTFKSLANTRLKEVEEKKFKSDWINTEIADPIFILGHWRSGTTFLQNILARDHRLAYPNLYQVMNPHTFLLTEDSIITRMFGYLIPKRRLFDNIPFSLKVPHEDEFIAWHSSGLTTYMGWNFPKAAHHFDHFLSFKEASSHDLSIWKADLKQFLQKLTLKYKKPIVLKSPQHTGRIGILLDMFPGAKFIHLHRNPYRVFQSTVKLNEFVLKISGFQKAPQDWIKNRVLRQYTEMYKEFFNEKNKIPQGQFTEVLFQDLERQPLIEMEKIYYNLNLPEFEKIKPALATYFESMAGYRKNRYQPITSSLKKILQEQWDIGFKKLGYVKEKE